jgi:hypothetical protein
MFHAGGLVGLWDDVTGIASKLTSAVENTIGGVIAASATPAINAGEAAVGAIAAPFGGLGKMLVGMTDDMGNGLKGWLFNLGGAVLSKQAADAAAAAKSGGVGPIGTQATGAMADMFNQILAGIGAPVNPTTLGDLAAWQRVEGGWTNDPDMFNPFNTTLPAGGSHGTNSVNVQSYPTFAAGLAATVATILQGNMRAILNALRGGAGLGAFEAAVNGSPWGTVFDQGGILKPGATLAINNTGRNETISPPGGTGNVYHAEVHVTVPPGNTAQETADAVGVVVDKKLEKWVVQLDRQLGALEPTG